MKNIFLNFFIVGAFIFIWLTISFFLAKNCLRFLWRFVNNISRMKDYLKVVIKFEKVLVSFPYCFRFKCFNVFQYIIVSGRTQKNILSLRIINLGTVFSFTLCDISIFWSTQNCIREWYSYSYHVLRIPPHHSGYTYLIKLFSSFVSGEFWFFFDIDVRSVKYCERFNLRVDIMFRICNLYGWNDV